MFGFFILANNITRATTKSQMSSNLEQITLSTYELSALDRLVTPFFTRFTSLHCLPLHMLHAGTYFYISLHDFSYCLFIFVYIRATTEAEGELRCL